MQTIIAALACMQSTQFYDRKRPKFKFIELSKEAFLKEILAKLYFVVCTFIISKLLNKEFIQVNSEVLNLFCPQLLNLT